MVENVRGNAISGGSWSSRQSHREIQQRLSAALLPRRSTGESPRNDGRSAWRHSPLIQPLHLNLIALDCLMDGLVGRIHRRVRRSSRSVPRLSLDSTSHWQQRINIIYKTGYTISLIALVLSLGILTYFRSLRCARITLHMNLFASFAVNNTLWLIWYGLIAANAELLMENGILCRLLHVILHYFLLTNYAWMLCEGFYLHTLLVSAFTSEHNLVKWLMCTGWPAPAIVVVVYATLRATSDDPKDNSQCWIDEGNYIKVLVYPVCVSTLLNLLFLFNIVRVLLTKLRAGPAIGSRPSRSMLQAFRATLLLVPLLGLHYLLTPLRPPKDHPWEQSYEIISAITASFQGLCVAVLFCFCNGEVIAQFKRKWEGSAFMRKRANSCTATTVSVGNPKLSHYA
ncbi:calcitonin gene-related peptide type 1 receptor isoform X2 [Diachasma alloeum]|uniref:calcitonin gene-related peptide type 1 receptor isoform X2 n=1 Tax=Diachasma alloeum TaxID=454923 RepID=UPI000738476E|nr:calcitonin gene-related peptide type 1 receptor isoform X2 [Diachasma alloeum]XP_015113249.1 calcitonin gene-related peptide type 1 receptor isoform X2 [Diachasma alloeum]XP_015113250.1 calcitonin gene-related peptide type 1 receptor isoform X2 [Diachasma alloeum]